VPSASDDRTSTDGDTIAAIATAAGPAGVGIVRVSGSLARSIGERVGGGPLHPGRVSYRRFSDAEGRVIDTGLVLSFEGPRSFTGEDVVEFQGHGGPVVLQMIVDQVLDSGARIARPGEFTERAYLNGKLDLVQAEAVADLIASASEEAVRGANRSLSGEFSRRVRQIDEAVVDLRVFVEAAIDFPDEDIDLLADGQVAQRIGRIIGDLEDLEAACAQGVILKDGIKLALIGEPNVGKSSLLNRLSGESRAIVTDIPGTTRDLVRADLKLDGLPVELVDTAGLREANDEVEAEGVRRALAEAQTADVVLMIRAFSGVGRKAGFDSNEWSVAFDVDPARAIPVLNKIDLCDDPDRVAQDALAGGIIAVSAHSGRGLEVLRTRIRDQVGFSPPSNVFTARKRHLLALKTALASAERSIGLARGTLPGELIAEELKSIHSSLGEIVGEMSSDALLGEIFSKFCIGK